ncbi:hypothetical protein AAC387_Pa05g3095 [Persea americana]
MRLRRPHGQQQHTAAHSAAVPPAISAHRAFLDGVDGVDLIDDVEFSSFVTILWLCNGIDRLRRTIWLRILSAVRSGTDGSRRGERGQSDRRQQVKILLIKADTLPVPLCRGESERNGDFSRETVTGSVTAEIEEEREVV